MLVERTTGKSLFADETMFKRYKFLVDRLHTLDSFNELFAGFGRGRLFAFVMTMVMMLVLAPR